MEPKYGGLILLLLPIVPLIAVVLTKSAIRRRYQGMILILSILSFAFFSIQYFEMIPLMLYVGNVRTTLLDKMFFLIFSNWYVPIFYYIALFFVYLYIARIRRDHILH
jgi:hypothetical protein